MDEAIENAVIVIALENPAFGQLRISNELKRKGMVISQGVRSICLLHNLRTFKFPLTAWSIPFFKKVAQCKKRKAIPKRWYCFSLKLNKIVLKLFYGNLT
uniref:hypothetical protein n=1 Tax=Zhouia sp. PK063 TaxID=3373602 RepID=UPI0037DCE8E0